MKFFARVNGTSDPGDAKNAIHDIFASKLSGNQPMIFKPGPGQIELLAVKPVSAMEYGDSYWINSFWDALTPQFNMV